MTKENKRRMKNQNPAITKIGAIEVDPTNIDPGMKALLRQTRDTMRLLTESVDAACETVKIAAAKRPIVDVTGVEDITNLRVLGAEMRLALDSGNTERLSKLIDMLRRSVNTGL
ncbi:MAG: hypothetical protein NC311_06790 [Muribaculaceae bacterium]|nr:hypothetical protein [Muribaculaceae bacterium]